MAQLSFLKDKSNYCIENELYGGKIKVTRIIKSLLSSPSQGTMVTHNGVSAMVRVTVIEFWLYFNHFWTCTHCFIYLFLSVLGSLLLHMEFLELRAAGATL